MHSLFSRVLLATDLLESSEKAMEYCRWLELHNELELFLLHISDNVVDTSDENEEAILFQKKELISKDQRALEVVAKTFRSKASLHIVRGDPSSEIIDFAHRHAIQQIVMGSHGYKGLSRLLMGSVAEHVVRNAPCAVTIVKSPS